MNSKKIILLKFAILNAALLLSLDAKALVSSPSAVASGQWNAELKSTFERGKVEPNENRASFQSAAIDIHQLSLSKGLDSFSFGADHFARIDLKYLKSGKEEVAGQTFYEADSGYVATLTGGFNFVHEATFTSGFYASISPITNFNKDKFSTPRVDLWSLGFKTSVQLNEKFYVVDSLHYGSGIPGKQNSYVAFTHLFALKLDSFINSLFTIKWGPYAELDTSERFDNKYDATFSPAGTQDRIRSMKIGVISSIEFSVTENTYGVATYVQKLGGYDAPATNALSFSIGANF